MVATDDEDLWRRVWSLKDHGKSWEAVYEREHPPGFRWLHESIGTNWRGTEVQAALGRIQYRRLDEWRAARTANAVALADRLDGVPGLRVPRPDARLTHAYYRLYAYLEPGALAPGWTRDRLLGDLRLPAPVLSGSCSEIYREVALRAYAPADPLPVAAELGETALAFLVHPGLGEAEMAATATAVTAVLDQARAAA
jgi:dTDP-4-amino-4,6-dideoxygalactose transaminase